MNLQQEINKAVRQAIMEEVNALGMRAAIREQIEATGVSHGDIKKMIAGIADSYFRSAMNGNVEEKIRQIFEEKIKEVVDKEIKSVIGHISWNGSEEVRRAINNEIAKEVRSGFDVSVTVSQKGGGQ